MSLFHYKELFQGSQEPDRIDGIGKLLQHHRHGHRVGINFNAAVDLLRQNNTQRTAWVIASAFHYLQDALDLSVHFGEPEANWVRNACYSILANWNQIGQNRNFQFTYNQSYASEWRIMQNLDVKQVVRRTQEWCPALARELAYFRVYLQPGIYGYMIQRDSTRPILKALAILQAGQDRILDLLQEKAAGSGLTDVTVNSTNITISLWDHGSEDGDLIQVFLNGQMMWQQIRLTKSRINLQLSMGGWENLIEIKALNEGSQSPNTASIAISNVIQGRAQQEWSLKTGQIGRLRVSVKAY
jgi:hypothetical protein